DGQYLSAAATTGSAGGLWAVLVDSGGTLVDADIINFGGAAVNTGGVAIDIVVSSGFLGVAGVAINTLDYDTVEVAYGGVAMCTRVGSGSGRIFGGALYVYSGGTASATTVLNGGTFELWDSSIAVDTTVGGGLFELGSGAVASDTTVGAGGE